eukprot:4393064-Karenia_brevis.AAC.1
MHKPQEVAKATGQASEENKSEEMIESFNGQGSKRKDENLKGVVSIGCNPEYAPENVAQDSKPKIIDPKAFTSVP